MRPPYSLYTATHDQTYGSNLCLEAVIESTRYLYATAIYSRAEIASRRLSFPSPSTIQKVSLNSAATINRFIDYKQMILQGTSICTRVQLICTVASTFSLPNLQYKNNFSTKTIVHNLDSHPAITNSIPGKRQVSSLTPGPELMRNSLTILVFTH